MRNGKREYSRFYTVHYSFESSGCRRLKIINLPADTLYIFRLLHKEVVFTLLGSLADEARFVEHYNPMQPSAFPYS